MDAGLTSGPPPVGPDLDETPPTTWPKTVGTISIVYASLGLLCQSAMNAGGMFSDFFMKMGGIDVQIPMMMKVISGVTMVVMWVLGIILIVGGIKLTRRRRGAMGLLKTWVVLRILVVIAAVVSTVVFLPVSMGLQEEILEATNKKLREGGSPERVQEFDEDKAWRKAVIGTAVASALFSAYPLFLGLYLSRRKIVAEVEQWD